MTATKPLALITGASSGIGLELARQFADHGFDLLVSAEDAGLQAASAELGRGGAEVHTVSADLRTTEGVETVYAAVSATGRPVSAAALNAGVGRGGAFLDTDLADDLEISNSTSPQPCTWPSDFSATWWPATTARC